METSLDGETKPNGPNIDKSVNKYSDDESNAIQNLVTSESKTPLKTPLKEGDADIQVKFIVNDSANGDAKIDIDNVKSAFAGMAKEELMKYANDPFWVRTRLILFIFFWAVWIAMFVGAIVIIAMAPRCAAPIRPAWFQEGPLYEVDVKEFVGDSESKNLLKDLVSKLEYLKKLEVKGLILNSLLKTDGDDESVIDFKALNEVYGSIEDLKNLTKECKDRGFRVIMSFVPNHSSDKHPWFNKSIANEEPYKNYYVWRESKDKTPPNNWLTVDTTNSTSAWTWNEKRQAFYLHQFKENQPDLNFHEPAVRKELQDILSFWLSLGISGFNLDKAQYLLEDPNFGNETFGNIPGSYHTNYDFYDHSQTYNRPETAEILSSWRNFTLNKTNDDGVLMITGQAPRPANSNETTVTVDLSRKILTRDLKPNFSAQDLHKHLTSLMISANTSNYWPAVQFGDKNSRVADLYGEDHVDGLNMVSLVLRATAVTYFGDELGLLSKDPLPWNNTGKMDDNIEKGHGKIYKRLIEEKGEDGLLYGNCSITVINNTVLSITRIKKGNPGYLVVYNPSSKDITINLDDIDQVPEELTLFAKSANYNLTDFEVEKEKKMKIQMKSKDFTLTSNASLAFTFVPKIKS